MKILILTTSVGDTAPGKVFLSYINMLKESDHDIDVITTKNLSNISCKIVDRKHVNMRLRKLSLIFLGFDIFDALLAKESLALITSEYDYVISMISAHNFFPLYAGYLLKKKNKLLKWMIYSVDAIPAPEGWEVGRFYGSGLIRMINNYFKIADSLCFSNEAMLNYQLGLLKYKFDGKTGVLYTIPSAPYAEYERKDNNNFNLVYTGGIYQARKVDELLGAFDLFQQEVDNAKLFFVGTNRDAINTLDLSQNAIEKIVYVNYISDLKYYYEIANVLIDVDANIDRDVFISSKFFNYCTVDRHILCITGKESPVTQFIRNNDLDNVSIVGFDRYNIYNTLKVLAGQNFDADGFRDRYRKLSLNFENCFEKFIEQ